MPLKRKPGKYWSAKEETWVPVLSVALGIGAWGFFSSMHPTQLLPTPVQVISALSGLFMSGVLFHDVLISLQRIMIGFILGCVVGIPLGLAMGLSNFVRAVFDPVVQFLRFVPPIAWLIPAIIWFGIGETSKVLIVFYMTVFLVLLNTMSGVSSIRVNYLRAAENYEVDRWQMLRMVVFPATMSFSIAGARIALGNSFAAVVGAELIGANAGLGYRIIESGRWMAMGDMLGSIILLGLLGLAADLMIDKLTLKYLGRFLMEKKGD
ncbi:ABC transporter permease [Castellaniella sp.]|uniref:ABC transporter permease n=1 Tax=Castellaniella sp. TaxID=1955812 RepID=UPI003A8F06DF